MEKPFGWVLRVSGGRGSAGALPLSAGCWVGGEPYWALGTVAAVCLPLTPSTDSLCDLWPSHFRSLASASLSSGKVLFPLYST